MEEHTAKPLVLKLVLLR